MLAPRLGFFWAAISSCEPKCLPAISAPLWRHPQRHRLHRPQCYLALPEQFHHGGRGLDKSPTDCYGRRSVHCSAPPSAPVFQLSDLLVARPSTTVAAPPSAKLSAQTLRLPSCGSLLYLPEQPPNTAAAPHWLRTRSPLVSPRSVSLIPHVGTGGFTPKGDKLRLAPCRSSPQFSSAVMPQLQARSSPPAARSGREHDGARPVKRVTDGMEKPSLDNRSYRVVRLPNELEVLIVHDPDTDKASAAIDVNVGNFSDEEAMPGMAHAVEHVCLSRRPQPPSTHPECHRSDISRTSATFYGHQEIPSGECLRTIPRSPLRELKCLHRVNVY